MLIVAEWPPETVADTVTACAASDMAVETSKAQSAPMQLRFISSPQKSEA
jgi:hypothetical protein